MTGLLARKSRPHVSEAALQTSIVAWLRLCVSPWTFHCPNGGFRNKIEAGRLKAQGVKAGIPDIGVPLPDGKILWIEVKAPGGVLSEPQKAFRDHIMALNGMWALVYDIDGVRLACRNFGIETREASS